MWSLSLRGHSRSKVSTQVRSRLPSREPTTQGSESPHQSE